MKVSILRSGEAARRLESCFASLASHGICTDGLCLSQYFAVAPLKITCRGSAPRACRGEVFLFSSLLCSALLCSAIWRSPAGVWRSLESFWRSLGSCLAFASFAMAPACPFLAFATRLQSVVVRIVSIFAFTKPLSVTSQHGSICGQYISNSSRLQPQISASSS